MNNASSGTSIKNEPKAWAVLFLVLAGIGFVASFPCRDTFWGGLSTSFFSAALVGGLADWFAVVSIFERPFGLSFLRAVIPDRKAALIRDLSGMITSELLAEQNIREALVKHDLTTSIKQWADSPDIRMVVAKLIRDILLHLLKNRKEDLERTTHNFFFRHLMPKLQKSPISMVSIIQGIIRWSDERGYLDKVWSYLIEQTALFVNSSTFRSKIENSMPMVISEYSKAAKLQYKLQYKLVEALPGAWPAWEAMLNSQWFRSVLASRIQKLISNYLEKNRASTLMPAKHKSMLINASERLAQNEYFLRQLGTIQEKIEADPDALHYFFTRIVKKVETQLECDKGFVVEQINELSIIICRMLSEQIYDQEKQAAIRDGVNNFLLDLIAQHRGKLPGIVADRFKSFSEGELENDMREAVGEDLQYIRINGTIIGGATGIGIFFIQYALGVFAGR